MALVNQTTGAAIHRRMIIDNAGAHSRPTPGAPPSHHAPLRNISGGDYRAVSTEGGVTWLFHPTQRYRFDVMSISGGAQVAILSDLGREAADLHIGLLVGDRTGTVHAGDRQTFSYSRVDVYLPVNVMAYRWRHRTDAVERNPVLREFVPIKLPFNNYCSKQIARIACANFISLQQELI